WVPDRYHESILYLRPEETRGIRHHILEISDMLCFRRRVYSIFVSSPSFSIIEGSFTTYSSIV
ncbi:hypothetical protein L208DRAFT_1280909, partial [Tricholoma matsutake]